MKTKFVLLSCLLAFGAVADDVFEKPFRLKSGNAVIDVNTGHAAPYLFDFDGDGKRDLLVGEFGNGAMKFEGMGYSRGRLRIYRNVGTEAKPRYDGFEWFKAGGKIAQVPITCCVSFCPELVDWDADGDMDMLTGSYPGHLYLYLNNSKGKFAAAEKVKDAAGDFLKPGTSTNPRAHDWDGDGDLDLVIATSSYLHVARNIGTRTAPKFAAKVERVKYRAQEFRFRGRLGCELADWNGDGRADLLIGHESAGVQVLFDTAEKGEPKFTERQVLIRAPARGGNGKEGTDYPGGRLKLHVADYNGDGITDLLVGDVNWPGETRPRKNLTAKQRAEYAAFIKRTDGPNTEIGRLVVERDLSLDRNESGRIQRRIFELMGELGDNYYKTKEKFEESIRSGTHGHVWVYLRKPR